ncbi:hypothetical protein CC85DRAFT_325258 [Cutaneotrichosporon oleaginosum]|uniref:Uncharacterized protein n=1 Tax=Cutaneotrichosporon oleaginosum TaxID=879819 RepID=A0A0J1BD70_9TREE|nr:uncharacterized protein CC85DRAFT_325258 [Cutaneotrichosporon oleaginosum]KLT46004.1 hypothetical protein CC85DRAFT_325258 [Cutaneotrichosporon oleaginosum]TXT06698.1 hypothetical protein COLE_06029 [Cutaneotrichosporon oleaginosum]
MERQLTAPLRIEPLGPPTKISTKQTYTHLAQFVDHLAPSPARTQLERLADALGVEVGAIAASEGEAREKKREAERAAARAERRRTREAVRVAEAEAEAKADKDALEAAIEGEEAPEDEGEEMGENFGDGPTMDDRGDVEYGDVPEDDEDEPDNETQPMDED